MTIARMAAAVGISLDVLAADCGVRGLALDAGNGLGLPTLKAMLAAENALTKSRRQFTSSQECLDEAARSLSAALEIGRPRRKTKRIPRR
jgi:hypothetical protein